MWDIDIAVIHQMLDAMSAEYERQIAALDPRTSDFKFLSQELARVNLAARYAQKKSDAGYAWLNINGRWLLESENTREVYRTTSTTCTCMAGLHGRACKHIIIAQVLDEISLNNSPKGVV